MAVNVLISYTFQYRNTTLREFSRTKECNKIGLISQTHLLLFYLMYYSGLMMTK